MYDNIASPLRSKLYRKDEAYIKQAIDKIARLMKIDGLYDRKPSQLSNGQRQRVAIGRCLVRTPNVFLMDEPLAHLDAKLKHLMRTELKEMQSEFNTTTIYVTHDYMEAMSLADRIAVMDKGEIRQLGTAQQMYYTPGSEFVARLFGEPEINLFPGEFAKENGACVLHTAIGLSFTPPEDVCKVLSGYKTNQLDIGIRGNDIRFSLTQGGEGWLKGTVYANEPIGNKVIMTVAMGDIHLQVVAPNDTRAALDAPVYLQLNTDNMLYFDRSSQEFVTRHDVDTITSIDRMRSRGKGGVC